MTSLQALVSGMIAGALAKQDGVLLDVDILVDKEGNYLPEIHVRGQASGEWLRISVEPMLAKDLP